MTKVVGVRRHDGGIAVACHEGDVHVHDIGVPATSAQQAHRAGLQLIHCDDGHGGIAKKTRHPSLTRTAAPSLSNDARGDGDCDAILDNSLQEGADTRLAALQGQQRPGVERQCNRPS